MCCTATVFAKENLYTINPTAVSNQYVGTLETKMNGKTSINSPFTLYYGNGQLNIPKFRVGKMPGSIAVLAKGLMENSTIRCKECVTLTILGVPTSYDANILVKFENGKLNVTIDVIDPIYDGASFIAHVVFTEN